MAQPPSASSDPRDPCATATSTHISSPPTYNPKHNVAAIGRSLAAGGVAGAVSRTAVAPLERLKILQQVEGASVAQSPYASTLGGLRHMWQQEGLRGWLRGNGSNCVRIIPNSAIKFVFYEALTDAIRAGGHHSASGVGDELSPLQRLSAGAVAGVVGMSATYPLDMVRGRLTVDSGKGRYSGIVHAAQSIVREEGAMALYKGWLPSVLGVVPYMGLNFAVYATLKVRRCRLAVWGCHCTRRNRSHPTHARACKRTQDQAIYYQRDQAAAAHAAAVARGEVAADVVPNLPTTERDLSVATRLACGAVAGACGQTVAFPFDVVRRRLQMVGLKDGAAASSTVAKPASSAAPLASIAPAAGVGAVHVSTHAPAPRYNGMVDCFVKTVREEGMGALWRGILPNYYKVVPSIAIAFVTYELVRDVLNVEFRISD